MSRKVRHFSTSKQIKSVYARQDFAVRRRMKALRTNNVRKLAISPQRADMIKGTTSVRKRKGLKLVRRGSLQGAGKGKFAVAILLFWLRTAHLLKRIIYDSNRKSSLNKWDVPKVQTIENPDRAAPRGVINVQQKLAELLP